jgi:hypothetical protein
MRMHNPPVTLRPSKASGFMLLLLCPGEPEFDLVSGRALPAHIRHTAGRAGDPGVRQHPVKELPREAHKRLPKALLVNPRGLTNDQDAGVHRPTGADCHSDLMNSSCACGSNMSMGFWWYLQYSLHLDAT